MPIWLPTARLFKKTWQRTLARAGVPHFRLYDLRSTYATRLSAGGVADEWVTQMLRQTDAKVFKKYSQMKLQMKRETLQKLNRTANEGGVLRQLEEQPGFATVLQRSQSRAIRVPLGKAVKSGRFRVGA